MAFEEIKTFMSAGGLGITPIVDVTGTEYNVIQYPLANGNLGAVPVIVAGNTSAPVYLKTVVDTPAVAVTTNFEVVAGLSVVVPSNGTYLANVRLSLQKPTGSVGVATVVSVHGLIDNQLSSNTAKQRSVFNDSSIHNMEFSFDGALLEGQVLTLAISANNTLCSLVSGTGYLAAEVSLIRL